MLHRSAMLGALALSLTVGWGALPSPAVARAAAPAAHDRVLPLQGGRNFRDLGGYRTIDGHHVKWGLLYRSGSMHGLTPADYAALERRGIRVVCDLRDSRERAAEPVAWPDGKAPRVLADDYALDQAGFMPSGPPQSWTAAQTRAAMTASYPHLLTQFNGQYRRMFGELLAGHAPLAFNCSAGKDRTGIAAALLLTALGVPRATVIADYELTNKTLDSAAMLSGDSKATPSPFGKLAPEVVAPFMRADRAYLAAALAVVDAHPGGAAGYLRDELGLGPVQIAHLRQLYLD